MTNAFKPVTTRSVAVGELPEVTVNSVGRYWTNDGIKWTPVESSDPYHDINTHIRGLLAIKLHMEAKSDARGDAFNAKLKQAAERIEAENKAAAAKKAHDDLRTSPIALKALAIYNRECIGYGPYESWDATNGGNGYPDLRVKEYIELAEQEEASEKEAAERLAARRLDIYKELGGVFFSNFEPQSPIGYAIDRIIALEDKAA